MEYVRKYNTKEYDGYFRQAIKELGWEILAKDFQKWLIQHNIVAPSESWLRNNVMAITQVKENHYKKEFIRNGYDRQFLPCIRQVEKACEYAELFPEVKKQILNEGFDSMTSCNFFFNRWSNSTSSHSRKDNYSIKDELESLMRHEGIYINPYRKYLQKHYEGNAVADGTVPLYEMVAFQLVKEVWLLRISGAKINDFIRYLKTAERPENFSLYTDEECYIEFMKSVLWLFEDASEETVETAYLGIERYFFTDYEEMPYEILTSIFFYAYNCYIKELIKKRWLSKRKPIDVCKEYLEECKERKIPPDTFKNEQNPRSKPEYLCQDDSRIRAWYRDYNLPEEAFEWLIKVKAKWADAYKDFTVKDFENIDRFKFVGRRIKIHQDPNAPYKAFTAFCIKEIRHYKNNHNVIPKRNTNKPNWEQTQIDWVTTELQFILKNQELYPLPDKMVTFAQNLLVEYYASKGEAQVAKWLADNGYKITMQVSFDDCVYKSKLRFDIKAEKDKEWFLVEYDGEQHYQYTEWFHKSYDEFEEQQKRDNIKNEYCKKNGIKLYRVRECHLKRLENVLPA